MIFDNLAVLRCTQVGMHRVLEDVTLGEEQQELPLKQTNQVSSSFICHTTYCNDVSFLYHCNEISFAYPVDRTEKLCRFHRKYSLCLILTRDTIFNDRKTDEIAPKNKKPCKGGSPLSQLPFIPSIFLPTRPWKTCNNSHFSSTLHTTKPHPISTTSSIYVIRSSPNSPPFRVSKFWLPPLLR